MSNDAIEVHDLTRSGYPIAWSASKPGGKDVKSLSLDQEGHRLLSEGMDGSLTLWTLSAADMVLVGRTPIGLKVQTGLISPSGGRVLAVDRDGSVHVWSSVGMDGGGTILRHDGPSRADRLNVRAEFVGDDGHVLTAWPERHEAWLWNLGSNPPSHQVLSDETVVSAASAPGDMLLAIDRAERLPAKVGDAQQAQWNQVLRDAGQNILVSADRSTSVSWDFNGDVWLYRFSSQSLPPVPIYEAAKKIQHARLTADGDRLLLEAFEQPVSVWDVSGDHPAKTILFRSGRSSEDWVSHMAADLSPDGRHVAVTGLPKPLLIFDTPPIGELKRLVRQVLTRCLTPEQRGAAGLLPMPNARPPDCVAR